MGFAPLRSFFLGRHGEGRRGERPRTIRGASSCDDFSPARSMARCCTHLQRGVGIRCCDYLGKLQKSGMLEIYNAVSQAKQSTLPEIVKVSDIRCNCSPIRARH